MCVGKGGELRLGRALESMGAVAFKALGLTNVLLAFLTKSQIKSCGCSLGRVFAWHMQGAGLDPQCHINSGHNGTGL